MTANQVREMAEHVASALAYLCERGAVHRDVKPANILRVGNVWKLGDFGLVRGFAGTSTKASARKGTVVYMSPEAMLGATGPFVDVWALGAVIQECLTGTLPYSGSSDTEIIAAALTREPSISGELTEPFLSVVKTCLVKDRQRRWTAKQVGDGLRGIGSPPPAAGAVRINPKDGAEMVYVPAGEFIMGSDDGRRNEKPRRKVYLDAYWMYKHEVTVAQYRKFCSETRRKMPDPPDWALKEDHPIVKVSWDDAKAYADWAGVQLPTEAQWEKAARGTDGRTFPWGDTFDPSKAVCSVAPRKEKSTAPVGSIPSGASPYGCLDMSGNVWEWCSDWYDGGYYARAPNRNPENRRASTDRVQRGGSWYFGFTDHKRASYRNRCPPDIANVISGFRCSS
jgi:serine/threonine-protein kinase